jgi:hypothetical protein
VIDQSNQEEEFKMPNQDIGQRMHQELCKKIIQNVNRIDYQENDEENCRVVYHEVSPGIYEKVYEEVDPDEQKDQKDEGLCDEMSMEIRDNEQEQCVEIVDNTDCICWDFFKRVFSCFRRRQ